MSIDNPTTPLDRALGAEERANHRVCDLEDLRDKLKTQVKQLKREVTQLKNELANTSLVAVAILPSDMSPAARKKLITELRPELEKVMS